MAVNHWTHYYLTLVKPWRCGRASSDNTTAARYSRLAGRVGSQGPAELRKVCRRKYQQGFGCPRATPPAPPSSAGESDAHTPTHWTSGHMGLTGERSNARPGPEPLSVVHVISPAQRCCHRHVDTSVTLVALYHINDLSPPSRYLAYVAQCLTGPHPTSKRLSCPSRPLYPFLVSQTFAMLAATRLTLSRAAS